MIVGLLVTPAFANGAHAQSATHSVQYGESLSIIAARYGVSAQALANANGIYNVNMIRVGQVLVIPGVAQPRQSTYSAPASHTYAPAPAASYCGGYVVRAGDTLYGVARRYGVDISIIRQYNGLYSDMIRVGQCLVIPSGVPAAPAPDRRRTSEQP
ncbi:MAG: LysM peptidoglycan-binding domain-containing protein [Caldilineaceae bacterium]